MRYISEAYVITTRNKGFYSKTYYAPLYVYKFSFLFLCIVTYGCCHPRFGLLSNTFFTKFRLGSKKKLSF